MVALGSFSPRSIAEIWLCATPMPTPCWLVLSLQRQANPKTLGLNDVYAHGTRVSGIVAYGDIRDCLENGVSKPSPALLAVGS